MIEMVGGMFSSGRIFRFLILILSIVALWKVWQYVGLGQSNLNTAAASVPGQAQSVMDTNVKFADKKIGGPSIGHDELVVSTTSLLNVQVFYEALCPDSRHFIKTQLSPSFKKLGEHISLQLVPYGKATTSESGSQITFSCQHGPTECLANKIHSCVVKHIKEPLPQLNIVVCMINNNYKPKSIARQCVTEVVGSDWWPTIEQCYMGQEGDLVLKHMGFLTNSLEPPVSFIPTITIDNSQDDQKTILRDFTKVLCSRFKGARPAACDATS